MSPARGHEVWLDRFLPVLLSQRGTFLDVGANLGQTFLKFLGAGGKAANYIGVEPSPVCCSHLRRLIRLNGLLGARIVPVALCDRPTTLLLRSRKPTDSCASTTEGFRPGTFYSLGEHVPALTGDLLLQSLDATEVCGIKIDVEGGELEVVRGLQRTLREPRPAVLCEVLAIGGESTQQAALRASRVRELEELLMALDYSFFRIPRSGQASRCDRLVSPDLANCDYLVVPNERRLSSTLFGWPSLATSAGLALSETY